MINRKNTVDDPDQHLTFSLVYQTLEKLQNTVGGFRLKGTIVRNNFFDSTIISKRKKEL